LERRRIPPVNRIHKLTALAYNDRELLGGSYTSVRCCRYRTVRFSFLNTMAPIFAAATTLAVMIIIIIIIIIIEGD
jgi:hypothetical protein